MNEQRHNDDPRDAHLLAALRHAPDRDALPPREVSERILAAARAAVQPARVAPWWQRLSAWLMQPQVAASFGTLAVASLVGVMWSTREPPVAEFAPSAPLAERADGRLMASAPAIATPAEAAKPDAGEVSAASAVGSAAELREAQDKLAAPPPPKAVGRDAAKRTESRTRATLSKAEAPAAPAAPAAATSAVTPPSAAPPPVAAPVADAAAPAAAGRRWAANEADSQGLARQQGAAPARSASAVGMLLAAKARAAEPLAGIDAALAAGARWQVVGSAGDVPHGPAQRAFWASVEQATRGHWEAVPPALPPAPWLVLEQGSSRAMVWIMDGALHVTAEGHSWRASVDAAQLADWQAQVARW